MLTFILLSKFCLDTENIDYMSFSCSRNSILPMGSPAVHPELLG